MGRKMFPGLACALAAFLTAPAGAQAVDEGPFKWRPAADDGAPRPWAIFLPGGGGLEVFHDTRHYYRWAEWFNRRGIDVLLVDHLALSEAEAQSAEGKRGENPGEMLVRFAVQGVAEARDQGAMDSRCPGIVVGWSLGGEGALNLASRARSRLDGLVAAVGFYPSIRYQRKDFKPRIPILTFQGEDDDITPLDDLLAFSFANGAERFDVRIHSLAHHGFDVEGLAEPVSWNGGTFAYAPAAAADAESVLDNEMRYWGMVGKTACALD